MARFVIPSSWVQKENRKQNCVTFHSTRNGFPSDKRKKNSGMTNGIPFGSQSKGKLSPYDHIQWDDEYSIILLCLLFPVQRINHRNITYTYLYVKIYMYRVIFLSLSILTQCNIRSIGPIFFIFVLKCFQKISI